MSRTIQKLLCFILTILTPEEYMPQLLIHLNAILLNGGLWRSDDGGYNWKLAAFRIQAFGEQPKGSAKRRRRNIRRRLSCCAFSFRVDSLGVPGTKSSASISTVVNHGGYLIMIQHGLIPILQLIHKNLWNEFYAAGGRGFLNKAKTKELLWQSMDFSKNTST